MHDPVQLRESMDDNRAAPQAGLPPTERQMEVLLAVVQEHGNREAAAKLGLSVQTVKNHVSALLARGPYHNVTHAVWVLWPVLRERENRPERRSHERRSRTRRR